MNTTQDGMPIANIQNDLVILKSGDMALILQTSAVNFGLLSENEQIAIIGAFAGMINSLSFPIQILIRSKRLDISTYLTSLERAQTIQQNPLLSQMIGRYRQFIEKLIRDNQVLDKQFYLILPLWSYEIGILKNSPDQTKKALNVILPRRDHIIRQLSGIGLSAKQLDNQELIKLFYDIYNTDIPDKTDLPEIVEPAPQPASEQTISVAPKFNYPPNLPQPQAPSTPTAAPAAPIENRAGYTVALTPARTETKPLNPRTPFVVEELSDEYGTV